MNRHSHCPCIEEMIERVWSCTASMLPVSPFSPGGGALARPVSSAATNNSSQTTNHHSNETVSTENQTVAN